MAAVRCHRPVRLPATAIVAGGVSTTGIASTVPLNMREGAEVVLEGWLLGTAQKAAQLETQLGREGGVFGSLERRRNDRELRISTPPGGGRHRLSITLHSPPQGAVVLDRLIVGGLEDR